MGRTQILHFWPNFEAPLLPGEGRNRKKKYFPEKTLTMGLFKYVKSMPFLLSPFREKYNASIGGK